MPHGSRQHTEEIHCQLPHRNQQRIVGAPLPTVRCPLAVWRLNGRIPSVHCLAQCGSRQHDPLPSAHCSVAVCGRIPTTHCTSQCSAGSQPPKSWPQNCPTRARRRIGSENSSSTITIRQRGRMSPRQPWSSRPAPERGTALCHRCATHNTQRAFIHTALPACIFPHARPSQPLPFGNSAFGTHRYTPTNTHPHETTNKWPESSVQLPHRWWPAMLARLMFLPCHNLRSDVPCYIGFD